MARLMNGTCREDRALTRLQVVAEESVEARVLRVVEREARRIEHKRLEAGCVCTCETRPATCAVHHETWWIR